MSNATCASSGILAMGCWWPALLSARSKHLFEHFPLTTTELIGTANDEQRYAYSLYSIVVMKKNDPNGSRQIEINACPVH
ncbi:MAG: hypothetical protein K2P68_06025 [Sphingomonas sp.]|nr:hypothetical protein [Sphingomonas sp.]